MSEPSQTKPFYQKNRELTFWMTNDLFEWLIKYLNKYSYGNSRSDKIRVLLYELQKQEEKGITIANPRVIMLKQRCTNNSVPKAPLM